MRYLTKWRTGPPYLMQRHAGLLLFFIGVVALVTPTTRNLLTLPDPLEALLFACNAALGVALYVTHNLSRLKVLLFSTFAACVATALVYTFGLGVNTASVVYLLEALFIRDLIGRVKADLELQHG